MCKARQRVSAAEPLTTVAPAEQLPDPKQLEEERERFLQEFNSQVVAAPLPPDSPTPAMHCDRHEKHMNSPAPATVCQSCYDELQERVDVLEAAMHMDIREAAQIVYDAVWADTSDPSKTYQNAAQALLIELRRRSAITPDRLETRTGVVCWVVVPSPSWPELFSPHDQTVPSALSAMLQ